MNFLPFDSYSIAWDPKQVLILMLYFVAASLPFLFAGWTAGASLAEAGQEAHLPYAAVFIGSALGCPIALGSHALWGELGGVALATALGLLAAAVFSTRALSRSVLVGLAAASLVLGATAPAGLDLRLSPYKPLALSRLAPGARNVVSRWSAASRVDVVESSSIHVFPGLSLNASLQIPEQAGLFVDGDGPLPITSVSPDDPSAMALAVRMPSSLAYQLRPNARTLILDPGAGLNVLIALTNGAARVSVPRDEPLVLDILSGPYAGMSAGLLNHPRVEVTDRAGRGALRSGAEAYDVIEFALSGPFRPVTSGAFSLTENYTLTVEAMGDAFARLSDRGLVVVSRWLGTPPSESARAWATMLAALSRQGVEDLGPHLLAYRSMRTSTFIASRRAFSPEELAATRRFLEMNGFDPIFLPDLQPQELNQHNRLPEPVYHRLYTALLLHPESTIDTSDFNLRPPTDDRPYFFHFFRWRQTPEVLATLGLTWQPFGGSGYFVLLALMALMLILAVPLMFLPLVLTRRARADLRPGKAPMAYFALLGAGYLMVEIPLIQSLTLLLDQPSIALAMVLFTLLLTSGIGSLLSPRLSLPRVLIALVGFVGLLVALLPAVIEAALPWGMSARLALTLGLLLAPGLLMGVPFAAGLRRLERALPGLIPWAWAVNGAVSGVSGVLAAIVGLDWGFRVVLAIGGLAYLGALVTARTLES